MSLIFCPSGTLVNQEIWLPEEPFDYDWARFGCNQLRCGRCGQAVRATPREVGFGRHYECACQKHDEFGVHVIHSDAGTDHAFETEWHCAGHPRLQLPAVLDGVEIPASGPDPATVHRCLVEPPFIAPGFDTRAFWVQRLFRLMSSEDHRAMVGRAVATHLTSEDPELTQSALAFFILSPFAEGAEQLAGVAARDRERLRATPAPRSSKASLYDRFLEAIDARLLLDKDGRVLDEPALEVAKAALLRGEAAEELVYAIVQHDAAWLAASSAAIVKAKPNALDYVLAAFEEMPEDARDHGIAVLRKLSKKADAAVRSWARENGISLRAARRAREGGSLE